MTEIVAYSYQASILCPDCTLLRLKKAEGIEGHGLSYIATEAIERMGKFRFGKEYADESNWDSDDFPKVIFAGQDEFCHDCGDWIG